MDGSDLEARENEGCVPVNERKNRQRPASSHDVEVDNRAVRRARFQRSMNPSEDFSEDEVRNNDPDFNDPRKAAGAKGDDFSRIFAPALQFTFPAGAQPDIIEDCSAIVARCAWLRYEINRDRPGWGAAMKHLALGAMVLSRCRLIDTGLREHCAMLHVIEGEHFLRARNGVAYVYDNGAFVPYTGVISESALERCRIYLLRLEAVFRRWPSLRLRGVPPRSNAGVLTLFDELLRIRCDRDGMTPEKLLERLENEVLDFEKEEKGKNWVEHMANNLSQTNTRLQKELLSCGPSQKPILAYYVEWCETPCTKTPGVCFDDACIVYDDTVSVSGNAGNNARRVIAHVRKTPLNNIYLRIRNNLLDPYEEAAMNRLKLYIQQTFWGNESAWECMLSAMSLAMRGYNVDRCFWTVGPGGVGQSLLPHHLNAVFRPLHAFLDTSVYYADDEFRKQADNLVGKIIVTAQEATEGGSNRPIREDLYKKHISGDPIQARLPYAIATKLVELVGWKRMELNKLVKFMGVHETTFESMLRRSWICQIKCRIVPSNFLPQIPNAPARGIFPRDPSLKRFLISGPAVAAQLKLLYGWQCAQNRQGCEEKIENYACGGDGGVTQKLMRFACGLDEKPEDEKLYGGSFLNTSDPYRQDREQKRVFSEKLAGAALEKDMDVSLHALKSTLGFGILPGNGHEQRKAYFQQLVKDGLWAPRGRIPRSTNFFYAPILETANTIEALFEEKKSCGPQTFPERYDLKLLEEYVNRPSRAGNVQILQKYYQCLIDEDGAVRRGRPGKERSEKTAEWQRRLLKLTSHETACAALVERLTNRRGLVGSSSGVVQLRNSYEFKAMYRARRYEKEVGAQRIPRRLRSVIIPEHQEWDVRGAHFEIAKEFADRLGIQLGTTHVTKFEGIREYLENYEENSRLVGKVAALKAMNGGTLPEEHAHLSLLRNMKREGRLLRWIAATKRPEVYAMVQACEEKRWPEATSLAHLLGAAEDFILEAWSEFVMKKEPAHLSLEFDGIRVDSPCVARFENFKQECEDAIYASTGYKVHVVRKVPKFLNELISDAATHKIDFRSADHSTRLYEEGNCIIAGIAPLLGMTEIFESKLPSLPLGPDNARSYRGAQQSFPCFRLHPIGDEKGKFPLREKGKYAWHGEGFSGNSYCIGIDVGTGGQCAVYSGGVKYDIALQDIHWCRDTCVESNTIICWEVLSSGDAPGGNYEETVLLDLRAGGEGGNAEKEPCAPGEDFIHELQCEVRRFRRSPHGDNVCKLCPNRSFSRSKQLLSHLRLHEKSCTFSPAGTKQIKIAKALYDNDRLRGKEEGKNYLERSAAILRPAVTLASRTLVQKGVTFIQDVDGPRCVRTEDLQLLTARRCGNTYYTRGFANQLFRDALTNEGRIERCRIAAATRTQESGSELASLVPVAKETWFSLLEDVFFSQNAETLLVCLGKECEDAGEFRSVSCDATYKPLLALRGQAACAARKSVKAKQALPAEDAWNVIYTLRGRSGAVLATRPCFSESAENLERLLSHFSAPQLAQIEHFATDAPSGKLYGALKALCGNLQFLSLDPLHLVFPYEAANWGKKTRGSSFLRGIMRKFVAVQGNFVLSPRVYTGCEPLILTSPEKAAFSALRAGTMSKERALELKMNIDVAKRFKTRAEFIELVTALTVMFPDEMRRTTASRKTVKDLLICACEVTRIEWYLNNTRYMAGARTSGAELLPIGTTSNEALHAEMKRWFNAIYDMHKPTLILKLRVFQLSKLLSHNSALYRPTIVQIRQNLVLARVAGSHNIFDEESWKEGIRRVSEEATATDAKKNELTKQRRVLSEKVRQWQAGKPMKKRGIKKRDPFTQDKAGRKRRRIDESEKSI